jgi:hypothetical protein
LIWHPIVPLKIGSGQRRTGNMQGVSDDADHGEIGYIMDIHPVDK